MARKNSQVMENSGGRARAAGTAGLLPDVAGRGTGVEFFEPDVEALLDRAREYAEASLAAATEENEPVAVTLAASDADRDALSYEILQPPLHGFLGGSAPALTYTPHAGYSGADSFIYRASDGDRTSDPAAVDLTVRPSIASDFRVQTVAITIPGGESVAHAFAPDDFAAVDPERTLIVISGVTQQAQGRPVAAGGEPADKEPATKGSSRDSAPRDTAVWVDLPDAGTLVATRGAESVSPDRVVVLLVEYRGLPGGYLEMLVRDRRLQHWKAGETHVAYAGVFLLGFLLLLLAPGGECRGERKRQQNERKRSH